MELNLNELERLAEDVQGWSNVSDAWANPDDEDQGVQMPTWIVGTIGDDVHYDVAIVDCEQYSIPGESEKLAKFYAAANPAVMLELVRQIRELKRDAGRYQKLRDNNAWGDDVKPGQGSAWGMLGELDGERFDNFVDGHFQIPGWAVKHD